MPSHSASTVRARRVLLIVAFTTLAAAAFVLPREARGAGAEPAPVFERSFSVTPGGSGMAVTASRIYVANFGVNAIESYNRDGSGMSSFGGSGSTPGKFNFPSDVTVDSAGNIYVIDTGNHRVQKFTSTGSFLTAWGSAGVGDGLFGAPSRIALDGVGNVYVADTTNNEVQVFTSGGAFLDRWPVRINGVGVSPTGLTVNDGDERVYVAAEQRIMKYQTDGTLEKTWFEVGADPNRASALATDSAGNVYAVDFVTSLGMKFTSNGTLLTTFGGEGSADGTFFGPRAMDVDSTGRVFVIDVSRIQSFVKCSHMGTSGNDLLTGTNEANVLCGLEGNDILVGGGGDDILVGGAGVDSATYEDAPAAVRCRLTALSCTDGEGGVDTLSGVEKLTGSLFADRLRGDAGANTLRGLKGDDLLDGKTGTDTLAGGVGMDQCPDPDVDTTRTGCEA